MTDNGTVIGISPAFVVSQYGPQFHVGDFCRSLHFARELGFTAFQPEIFRREAVLEWHWGGALEVARQAARLGMIPSQFVAHFLMEQFSCLERLIPRSGTDTLKQVVDMVSHFDGCSVLTIPIGPFVYTSQASRCLSREDLCKRIEDKIHVYLNIISQAGLKLAFEILTDAPLGWIDLCRLCRQLQTEELGFNLDTGHVGQWGDLVPLLTGPMREKVFGVHLKDLVQESHHAQTPGMGALAWERVIPALMKGGYQGSLDVEILCPPEVVEKEYLAGKKHIQTVLHQTMKRDSEIIELPSPHATPKSQAKSS